MIIVFFANSKEIFREQHINPNELSKKSRILKEYL
jgi:hypothetical protein